MLRKSKSKFVVNNVFKPNIVLEDIHKEATNPDTDSVKQFNPDTSPDEQPPWFFRPANEVQGWEKIRKSIYNPEKGEFLLRTPKSWFQLILFYIGYYGCLVGFWFCMLAIFYTTLDVDIPKWTLDSSRIGSNPGLGMRPQIMQNGDKMDDLKYSFFEGCSCSKGHGLNNDYTINVQQFLSETANLNENSTYADCNETEWRKPREKGELPCRPRNDHYGPCGISPFGYEGLNVTPCIFVKINKIFGFVPQPLQPEDFNSTSNLPENIQQQILESNGTDRIYIDCQGATEGDAKTLRGNLKYYPEHQGVPMGYFPFQYRWDVSSPGIAVQFGNITRNQLIQVICKVWFKGVIHVEQKGKRRGLHKFQIEILQK